MATNQICKEDVLNSLSMFNTVGQELENIFNAHGIDKKQAAKLMECEDLPSKEKLTDKQRTKACEILGKGDELKMFLKNFQEDYLEEKAKCLASYKNSKKSFNKLKNIIPLLRDEFTRGIDKLDDILDYFDVDSEEEIFAESEKTAALFRQQNSVPVDPINLKAWLRRGELDFQKMEVGNYDESGFQAWIDSKEWEQYLNSVDYFMQLPQILARYGVVISLVPFLDHTVYGAVRWFDEKPLIQISDRNQDLATCWFTLFHEFGHVIMHRNESILEGQMNETKSCASKRETEANKFANHYLFNGDDLRKEVFCNKRTGRCMTASQLAIKYGVNPIFTSYWLRKAQYNANFQKRVHIDFLSAY